MTANSASSPIWRVTSRLAISILAAICAISCVVAQPGKEPSAPKIVFDAETFDFGKVEDGIQIEHKFKVTNSGGSLLKIYNVDASCGCTTPEMHKRQLQPGESATLDVIVDTTMKQFSVTKTIHVDSNDPVRPIVNIEVKMDVLDPHRNMKKGESAKIFTDEKCASCHVYKGTGLFGADLYNADCAMCHGPKAEGAVGPALFGPYTNPEFSKTITQITSYGSKTHRSMPGFLGEAGGPLNKEQIDSIVKYLADLSKKRMGK
jgi:mono/diheme cytochrome c family protein